ncbi:MAG: phosphatidylglycerophosphatase A [Betaproteobacteria bacterium]|nr:phosphatidylglycerophosphatase A [Betaproteobacteria bacterium]
MNSKPPSFRFLLSHPAHFFALGCGSGLSRWMPGTAGSLFAWAAFVLFFPLFSPQVFLLFLAVAFFLGIYAIHKTGLALGEPDHGSIVWDEIVPFWAVLFLTPADFFWQLAAFSLFRFFDIVKLQPARWFDERMKNGFGVMLDDVVAALYTLFVLAIIQWLV